MKRHALTITLLITTLASTTLAQEYTGPKPADYLRVANRDITQYHDGKVTGENFCWHAASYAESFVTGYKATGNTAWLDAGQTYFNHLISLMAKGSDGYRGWIGPFIYNKENLWCDVHIGDAILLAPMLRFSETVLKDKQLIAKYGPMARQYIKIAKKDFVEKWEARGTWVEDGPFGFYHSWDQYMTPGKFGKWQPLEDSTGKSGISLPFNKNMSAALVSLRIYRITGEEQYRDIAERVFLHHKARIQLVGDYYRWNYWEPLGQWDIQQDERRLRHWVNTHPYRDYQAGEVHDIVEAYHSGIVYTRQDIQYMINTNLNVMWNGSLDSPKWRNSDKKGEWKDQGTPDKSKGYPRYAGTLWGLSDFNETIRTLSAKRQRKGSVDEAYFHNVTMKTPVSFDRKYVDDDKVSIPEVNLTVCKELITAAVLPSEIQRGELAIITSKGEPLRVPVTIDLYASDGQTKIETLYSGDSRPGGHGAFRFKWTPADIEPGNYFIRWTTDTGHRQYPIEIK